MPILMHDDDTDETVEVALKDAPTHTLVRGAFVEYASGKFVRAARVWRVEPYTAGSDAPALLTLDSGEQADASVLCEYGVLQALAALNMALEGERKPLPKEEW